MKVKRKEEQEHLWDESLQNSYKNQERSGTHVSALLLCLRQTALSRLHEPVWDSTTLQRFQMGRAMEKAFFSEIMPSATQELEVEQDGIVGHIDFGSEPVDYECKLTWKKELDDPEELFKKSWWWLDQAGAYTFMRKRTKINFVVCFINFTPRMRCYEVEWTPRIRRDME